MKLIKDISFVTLFIIGIILSIYRISNINNKEIAWDVLGYYMPLPATFIHNDPLLNNIEWLKKVNNEKDLTGTLYMVSTNNKGEPMYFFLLGMSLFYLPFFLIGHFFSFTLGFPMDGFSPPYQYALVIGSIIFTLIGLYYFRKILQSYFSNKITSLILLITVFSTNYIHHLTLKNLETVNVLFMLICITTWFTIKWHKEQKLKYLILIGTSITLLGMVKPSEILILFIPLFWNIYSLETAKRKIVLIAKYKYHLFITIGICILIASPQIIYWLIKTGMPFYDSYKNPGVGLDIYSPHILDTLFSYRKGWLLYTPVMIFYLLGFPLLLNNNKNIFFAISIYFLSSFYIISSWSEWWYGAGFSNRPLIAVYPLLAISFGYLLTFLQKKGLRVKIGFAVIIFTLTFLNQFQWWQMKNYIIDPYRTTKAYYWASFFNTSIVHEDKKLLLIERNFTGDMNFDNRESYQLIQDSLIAFEDINSVNKNEESLNSNYLTVAEDETYILSKEVQYKTLTANDHIYIVISFDLKYTENIDNISPYMVFTMNRKEGNYGYYSPEIKIDSLNTNWKHYSFEYLTPPIRDHEDRLKYYIWKRGKKSFDIDNFHVEIFEKKNILTSKD